MRNKLSNQKLEDKLYHENIKAYDLFTKASNKLRAQYDKKNEALNKKYILASSERLAKYQKLAKEIKN